MPSLEDRIQFIEDRFALQDVVNDYCASIDSLTDVAGVANCFTEDAVFDLTGLGLAVFNGRDAIYNFFEDALDAVTHHAHYATNFTVDNIDSEKATGHNYIIGLGLGKNGSNIVVNARYDLEFERTPDGWKISHFSEPVLMPLPDEVGQVHGQLID
jgi:ketosteroid isomerase-like protein